MLISNFESLVQLAKKEVGKRELTEDMSVGKACCVAVGKTGRHYTGLSKSTSANLGFCAEISALSKMLDQRETEVVVLLTVNDEGKVIPPCGKCREFLFQMNHKNLQTKVLLSPKKSITLAKLLPERWQQYWRGKYL